MPENEMVRVSVLGLLGTGLIETSSWILNLFNDGQSWVIFVARFMGILGFCFFLLCIAIIARRFLGDTTRHFRRILGRILGITAILMYPGDLNELQDDLRIARDTFVRLTS